MYCARSHVHEAYLRPIGTPGKAQSWDRLNAQQFVCGNDDRMSQRLESCLEESQILRLVDHSQSAHMVARVVN